MLSSVKNNFNLHKSNSTHALLLSTYSALFFCLSASFSWLILTKKFGVFPVGESWKSDSIQWRHGSKLSWIWVMRHCELSSSYLGTSSPAICRYDLRDRRHHIHNCAGAFVRLVGRVDFRQGHTLHHFGVRSAFLRARHRASVMRMMDGQIFLPWHICVIP